MEQQHAMHMGWGRFAAMIVTSSLIMFFLMYQLVYSWDHALFSLTRLVSSIVMGCVMTAVMLAFMWKMYQPQAAKIIVLAASIFGGVSLLAINRGQSLVGDTDFMSSAGCPARSAQLPTRQPAGTRSWLAKSGPGLRGVGS